VEALAGGAGYGDVEAEERVVHVQQSPQGYHAAGLVEAGPLAQALALRLLHGLDSVAGVGSRDLDTGAEEGREAYWAAGHGAAAAARVPRQHAARGVQAGGTPGTGAARAGVGHARVVPAGPNAEGEYAVGACGRGAVSVLADWPCITYICCKAVVGSPTEDW
jgi:hypothetical protein